MNQHTSKLSFAGKLKWRILALAGIAATVAAAAALLFQPAPASIKGSVHDFSAIDPGEQICIFCHTAHGADLTVPDSPLWNHTVTTKVYKVYSSPTLQATVGQPSGSSKLCLSCHDGTVAVDSYSHKTGVIHMTLPDAVGADELNNDHPISFVYDDALASKDTGLFPPSSHPSGLGGTINKDLLIANRVECSSCHDVHNGPAAMAVNDNLLVITQQQSQLCLTCHNK